MHSIGAAPSAPREEIKQLPPQGAGFAGPYPREEALRRAGFMGGRPSGMRETPLPNR